MRCLVLLAWVLAGCGDDDVALPSDARIDAGSGDARVADGPGGPDGAGADGPGGDAPMVTTVPCGNTCLCVGGDACQFDCGSFGCNQAECIDVGIRCTGNCVGGDCDMDCDQFATCSYDCPGGGCAFDCDRFSSCTHSCAGGDCELLCDGDADCTLDCTGASFSCRIECQDFGHATCTGNCVTSSC
jgi:hypothetical protein